MGPGRIGPCVQIRQTSERCAEPDTKCIESAGGLSGLGHNGYMFKPISYMCAFFSVMLFPVALSSGWLVQMEATAGRLAGIVGLAAAISYACTRSGRRARA